MKIALDTMGGDYAPYATVAGAVMAVSRFSEISKLYLVGNEDLIVRELKKEGYSFKHRKIEIVNTTEVIEMYENPALAFRKKRNASITRCAELVKSGEAEALVSAGNTGAVVVAGTLKLGLIKNVQRPAIACVMPTEKEPVVLIDAGANVDSTPQMLVQFGAMGVAYSSLLTGKESPTVALLSIGTEDVKGNDTTLTAFSLFKNSKLNFLGNVESYDIFSGAVDVVVCDGFVGNIVLKTGESVARFITRMIKEESKKRPWRIIGAGMLWGVFRKIKKKADPDVYGGAVLLGVDGICIIAHGSSSPKAIVNAIRVGVNSIQHSLKKSIEERIALLNM